MFRFAWVASSAVLISGCTLYFGGSSDDQPGTYPDAGIAPGVTGARLDRECLVGVTGGNLVDVNRDELEIAWGCNTGMQGETVSYGQELVVLFGTYPQAYEFELLHIEYAAAWAIKNDHHTLLQFGAGFPQTGFDHPIIDVARLDFDSDGTNDFVTTDGTGAVKRGPVPAYYYWPVEPQDETTLLTGKPYRYLAVSNFSGTPSPDIFYTTTTGQLGLATQTSPDQFTDQVLGTGVNPQRLHLADVDGDGVKDVVGASPNIFVYSTKTHTLVQLAEKARAIDVGDIDGDGISEPVYLTEDGTQVRRVVGLTAANAPTTKAVLNTTEAQVIALAKMDDDVRSDVALIHDAGLPASWLEVRLATSF